MALGALIVGFAALFVRNRRSDLGLRVRAMIAPLVRIEPFMGIDHLLQSFFVPVVGGLGALEALFTGSALIGGSESLASYTIGGTAG